MARRRKTVATPEPAFEFTITQADFTWGAARGLHHSAIAAHAIQRTLTEQGVVKADIAVSELLDRIEIVADGKRIL